MNVPSLAPPLLLAALGLGCIADDWHTVRARDAGQDPSTTDVPRDLTEVDAPCPSGQMPCEDACVAGSVGLYRGEGDARDAVGALHAVFSNVGYASGRVGQALSFGGVSTQHYVELPPRVGNFGASDFTIALWFNTTYGGDILSKRAACWGGPAFTGQDLRMTTNGNFFIEMWTTTGYLSLRSQTGLNDGAWHHLALVREGGTMRLFIDADAVASHAIEGEMTDPSDTPTYLGVGRCVPASPGWNGTQDGTGWFDGLIDEVGFYPRALSASELTATAQGRCGIGATRLP